MNNTNDDSSVSVCCLFRFHLLNFELGLSFLFILMRVY